MIIVKCPFNKRKILCEAMIGLEKSFRMMYSNIGLNFPETVPLKILSIDAALLGKCNLVRHCFLGKNCIVTILFQVVIGKKKLSGNCPFKKKC